MKNFILFSLVGLYFAYKVSSKPEKRLMGNPRNAEWEKEKTCEECGKKYKIKKHGHGSRFCSDECRKLNKKKDDKQFEIRSCEICGDDFETYKRGKTRTCSSECFGELRSRQEAKKEKKFVELPMCAYCGEKPVKEKRRRFCSFSCQMKAKREANPELFTRRKKKN